MNHWGKNDRNHEYQDSNDSTSTADYGSCSFWIMAGSWSERYQLWKCHTDVNKAIKNDKSSNFNVLILKMYTSWSLNCFECFVMFWRMASSFINRQTQVNQARYHERRSMLSCVLTVRVRICIGKKWWFLKPTNVNIKTASPTQVVSFFFPVWSTIVPIYCYFMSFNSASYSFV